MKFEFHKGAKRDLLDGFRWYQERSEHFAGEFYNQVSTALDKIGKAPTQYRPWKKGSEVRVIKLDRFPYLLYYTIAGQNITIIATAHDKRRPGYWLRRLD